MSDFNYIDIGASPYFTPQDSGDGTTTLGQGDGSDWMDWDKYLNQDQYSSFLTPAERGGDAFRGQRPYFGHNFNSTAFRDWLSSNQYQLGQQNLGGNSWARGVFDQNNKPVSKIQYGTNEDPMFGLAMGLMGAAGGQLVGGLSGLGSLGSGALSGGISAGAQNADLGSIIKGAAQGGLASYTPNVAGMVGAEGTLGKIVNAAAKGGVQSAIGGGNIGKGAVTAGAMAGLNSLGEQKMDGEYSRAPWATGPSPSFNDFAPQQSAASWSSPSINFPMDTRSPETSSDFWNTNPLGKFMSETWNNNPQRYGDLAQGLLGMYSGLRRQRMARDIMGRIGANRDSYLANMRNKLQAQAAATGRRSNVAGRETQLQGLLAELDSRNAPALAQLSDARLGGLESMFASGLRMGGKMGLFGDQYRSPVAPVDRMETPNFGSFPQLQEPQQNLDFSLQDLLARRGRVYGGM